MKVLTIRQPFAWAVARGFKPIENRGWMTAYRGQLAVHAAKKWDDGGEDTLREVVRIAHAQGSVLPKTLANDLPYTDVGLVIATAELVDICTKSLFDRTLRCKCGPWAQPMQAHWQLANARPLPNPVAATGHLGLWDWNGAAA